MKDDKVLKAKINAKGMQIPVVSDGSYDDYISLTDIAKYKNPEYPGYVIQNWMRNRSTIEFLDRRLSNGFSTSKLLDIWIYFR